jgi:hypothetical protein
MNEYQRAAIAKKTGEDPLKKKPTGDNDGVLKKYALINTRDGSTIIIGAYKLCRWKQNLEKRLNPLLKTEIRPA